MKKWKLAAPAALCLALALALAGCAGTAETAETPQPDTTPGNANPNAVRWPQDKLKPNQDGIPILSVYVVEEKKVREVDVETYVQGVLAGEMKNDWPMEALKAQAILARTFVLKFVQEKKSQYEGADISTDVEEAQAYDAKAVDERIKQAVRETAGVVLSSEGELPYTWFHAHSGGKTALAKEGLNWNEAEPPYTRVTESREPSPDTVEDSKELAQAQDWEATFSLADFQAACQKQSQGLKVTQSSKLAVGQKGDSGRTVTLTVDGKELNAADLRIALGSTKMRSTLLSQFALQDGKVAMAGKGYGHGVGMSQWGAYGMAAEGKKAKEIIRHYFQQVELVKLW